MKISAQLWSVAVLPRLLKSRFFRLAARVRAYRLVEIGTSREASSTLMTSSDGICSIPAYTKSGGFGKPLSRTFPELRSWEISNGWVSLNHRFSSVHQPGVLYINDRVEPPPLRAFRPGTGAYQTGNIVGQSDELVFEKAFSRRTSVDALIYVGTRATYNWSHFLIDFLPGIYLANQFGSWPKNIPVVVPNGVLESVDFLEVLHAVTDGRKILTIDDGEAIEAERVFWIDPAAYGGPFTERTHRREPLVWHRDAMTSYRDFLRKDSQSFSVSPSPGSSRRIYIDRPDGRRSPRINNLHNILRDFDFEAVDMALLNLKEKTELMADVSHVVSPSGSGLANLVFARPGVKVLAFTENRAPLFDNFVPNLVDLAGGTLSLFAARDEVSVASAPEYEIREDLFRAQLEAFSVSE